MIRTIIITVFCLLAAGMLLNAQDARDIIKRADEKMQGESWTKGRDYSLALITAPAREKGQTFLKRENEMWNWNPTINRLIKLPPSMMSQGWMGSDFSNDDLLKESSIVVDYTHTVIGEEEIDGWDCYKIELIPHEDAAVVWGKVLKWVSKKEYLQMKSKYYDEDDYLVKTELAYEIKTMDGRLIPSKFELIPEEEEGHKTMIVMDEILFNKPISDGFFSQQNMKNVR